MCIVEIAVLLKLLIIDYPSPLIGNRFIYTRVDLYTEDPHYICFRRFFHWKEFATIKNPNTE